MLIAATELDDGVDALVIVGILVEALVILRPIARSIGARDRDTEVP